MLSYKRMLGSAIARSPYGRLGDSRLGNFLVVSILKSKFLSSFC